MTARWQLIIGGVGGAALIICGGIIADAAMLVWLAFAFGALFGKGYGAWEDRAPYSKGEGE